MPDTEHKIRLYGGDLHGLETTLSKDQVLPVLTGRGPNTPAIKRGDRDQAARVTTYRIGMKHSDGRICYFVSGLDFERSKKWRPQ